MECYNTVHNIALNGCFNQLFFDVRKTRVENILLKLI